MKIEILRQKGVCSCCKKVFESGFEVDLNKRFLNKIKICPVCGKEIYFELGKLFVPKSPKNINAKMKFTD